MRVHRTVSIWIVVAVSFCFLAIFLVGSGKVTANRRDLEEQYEQSRINLNNAQQQNKELKVLLNNLGTDSFIENQARTLYGYMRPDEIRFVITNPEVLYGTEEVPAR